MKKLKKKLTRKICDILSSVALYCDGRGYFKVSNLYRFPISEKFYVEVIKYRSSQFIYQVTLKKYGIYIIETLIEYDIFKKDVPFQKAYTIKKINCIKEFDNILDLKNLLEEIKKERT